MSITNVETIFFSKLKGMKYLNYIYFLNISKLSNKDSIKKVKIDIKCYINCFI